MPGFALSFTIQGEQQLSRRLRVLSEQVKDWTPAFVDTATKLKDTFSGPVFDTQGAIIESPWSPLSKAYALRKARKYGGQGILEATGRMRESFWATADAKSATIGNSAPYFKYHQSNQQRSSGLPRRPMLKLAERQREEVVKIFQAYFQKAMNE